MTSSELHSGVDVLRRRVAPLDHPDGLQHVGNQEPIDDEAWNNQVTQEPWNTTKAKRQKNYLNWENMILVGTNAEANLRAQFGPLAYT